MLMLLDIIDLLRSHLQSFVHRIRTPHSMRYCGRSIAPTSKYNHCHILTLRFFNVNGLSFPCPFIRNASGYLSDKNLLNEFAVSSVPGICAGLREIGGAER